MTSPLLDFGQERWFLGLDAPRRLLWDPSSAALLRGPSGLDLRPGLLVADLGCGWGYLGHLLRSSVVPGGRIDGFDLDEDLLRIARQRARSTGGGLRFQLDDASALEVRDGAYDRAVCQTLLIHQGDPLRVLREMRRIVRPGGLVVAIEPDELAAVESLQDDLRTDLHRRDLLESLEAIRRGTAAIGAGDHRLGPRLPTLFAEAGLSDIRSWMNPTLLRCDPPCEARGEAWRRILLDESEPEAHRGAWASLHPLFDAGGGTEELWERTLRGAEGERRERRRRLLERTYQGRATRCLWVCVGRADPEGSPGGSSPGGSSPGGSSRGGVPRGGRNSPLDI